MHIFSKYIVPIHEHDMLFSYFAFFGFFHKLFIAFILKFLTSLVQFILLHFIFWKLLEVKLLSWFLFSIIFYDCITMLLNFCMLNISCNSADLFVFMTSSWNLSDFLYIKICHFQTVIIRFTSCQFGCTFFSCLGVPSRNFRTILNKFAESGHLCAILDIGGKAFSFPIHYNVKCTCYMWYLFVGMCSFYM